MAAKFWIDIGGAVSIPVSTDAELGGGRGGNVYALSSEFTPNQLTAVLKEIGPEDWHEVRPVIEFLLREDPNEWYDKRRGVPRLCLPVGLAYATPPDASVQKACGYAMPTMCLPEVLPGERIFSVKSTRRRFPRVTWSTYINAAMCICETVAGLHEKSIIVCDLALENCFVNLQTGGTTLIDVDSFSIEVVTGRRHGLRHYRPENYPSSHWTDADSDGIQADLFALAVVVSRLLLEGFHPFAGTPVGGFSTAEGGQVENMNLGLCWPVSDNGVRLAPGAPPAALLPDSVRGLLATSLVQKEFTPYDPSAVAFRVG